MRMLVIDDEEDICELICELGERHGLEVRTISAPEKTVSTLEEFHPDLVVLDLMMPGTDGVELLRLLAEHAKNAQVCLISGSDTRVLNSARRLGSAHGLEVVAAMEKPLSMPMLTSLFEKLAAGNGKNEAPLNIKQAIDDGQLALHFQPIVEIATRRVKGAEGLLRWQHPQRGLLLPDIFLDQAVNDGLMQAVTDVAIQASITQATSWHRSGEDLILSLNITASALLDLTFPDRMAELCKHRDLPPDRLILEVTETEAMRDTMRTMDVLLRMRIRNIGVSIDDFGTGHSSLRELQRMPFSEMKIDKSFVTDMANSRDCAVIVNSIIDLGHNLGLKIIAEGVEDVRVWRMLADKGCDYAQGYFIAKAMPPHEFNVWLKNWREKPAI
ncbi:MAG: EAL domain-containing response regulator [Bdellovibrionales bacterium]